MLQIRRNIFETNSSSVHAMTICTKDEYDKFRSGELYWDSWCDAIMSKEEILEEEMNSPYYAGMNPEELWRKILTSERYKTFDDFSDGYEDFIYDYTTPSGDEIVVIGYYGHD